MFDIVLPVSRVDAQSTPPGDQPLPDPGQPHDPLAPSRPTHRPGEPPAPPTPSHPSGA